jgi:hypothetical protein
MWWLRLQGFLWISWRYSETFSLSCVQMSACSKQVCFICNVFWSLHNAWKCGEMPVNFINLWLNCSAVFQEVFFCSAFRLCSFKHQQLLTFWIYNTVNGLFIFSVLCYCNSINFYPLFYFITFLVLLAQTSRSICNCFAISDQMILPCSST